VFTAIRITVRLKLAKLPDGASWQQIYGVALYAVSAFGQYP
jgi:Na+/H+ antiporter NhaA